MSDEKTEREITTSKNHVVSPDLAARKVLGPRMAVIRQRLNTLVERWGTKAHRVETRYALADVGVLQTYYLQGLVLHVDNVEEPQRLKLTYDNVAKAPLSAAVDSSERFFDLRRMLNEHRVPHRSGTAANVGKLTCGPSIPVDVRFAADRSAGRIWVRLRNVNGLGVTEVYAKPQCFDEGLMDDLEHLMFDRPNEFYARLGVSGPIAPLV